MTCSPSSRPESRGESRGTAKTEGETQSESSNSATTIGITIGSTKVPFYEYREERNISSRTFETEAEFLTVAVQLMKAQPKAHFLVKTDGSPAVFCRAPYVPDPRVSGRQRNEALAAMYEEPFYLREGSAAPIPLPEISLPYQVPPPTVELPEPIPDQGDDPWQ